MTAKRAQEAWGGTVPSQMVFYAQFHGTALFITRDWEVTFRSRRLLNCVEAMCAILNTAREQFSTPIGIELLDTRLSGNDTLYDQLDRERKYRRVTAVAIWLFGLMAGGLVSWLIQSLLG